MIISICVWFIVLRYVMKLCSVKRNLMYESKSYFFSVVNIDSLLIHVISDQV